MKKKQSSMTATEWQEHLRELSRARDKRRQDKRIKSRKEKIAEMNPEEYKAYRDHINSLRRAKAREKGIQPRGTKKPVSEIRKNQVVWAKKKRQESRIKLYNRYGGLCNCCGTSDPRWLSIHHKNKDGKKDRTDKNGKLIAGLTRLKIMLDQPIRDDLELLCYNCHLSLDHFGVCPHNDPESPYFIQRLSK